jgi:uncharacterized repeat protein (TIGR03803 family)
MSTGYASRPTILVTFNGSNGANPYAGLIADATGDLFGTTESGGAGGYGTVFEIPYIDGSYASTPITLLSFNGSNGANPYAGLIADAASDSPGTACPPLFSSHRFYRCSMKSDALNEVTPGKLICISSLPPLIDSDIPFALA